jgi:vacuolar-type H+-ATPase subunit H
VSERRIIMTERHERPDGPTRASQLEELLACEQELAQLLSDAREDSRRRVEEARALAVRAEADLQTTLEGEADQERASIRQEAQARVRETLSAAAERASRLDSISDERVERLADAAFSELLQARSRT